MSAPRGGGFTARNWLENDGDLVDPAAAAERPGLRTGPWGREFDLGAVSGVLLAEGADVTAACRVHAIVVATGDMADVAGCTIIDEALLARGGPFAVDWQGDGLRLTPTKGAARLWSPPKDQ
jgi:competence protein ComEC